jgi:AraC-like DNA-binding protein
MQKAEAEINSIPWTWIILILVAGVTSAVWYLSWRKHHRAESQDPAPQPTPDSVLMQRICELMEKEKPFLNPELKISDVASALGTNRTYLSDCINSQRGCSFTQFINGYRIDHAKRILRQDPNKKIADVYMEAGFANEQSFFRTFKAITGMTPSEWKAQ